MIKLLRNLFKPKTVRLELRFVSFAEAERLLAMQPHIWQVALPEEDTNRKRGWVWLERRGPNPERQ